MSAASAASFSDWSPWRNCRRAAAAPTVRNKDPTRDPSWPELQKNNKNTIETFCFLSSVPKNQEPRKTQDFGGRNQKKKVKIKGQPVRKCFVCCRSRNCAGVVSAIRNARPSVGHFQKTKTKETKKPKEDTHAQIIKREK